MTRPTWFEWLLATVVLIAFFGMVYAALVVSP